MVTVLLSGRKGSKGVRNKNIYPVLGRPLMWYPLQAALHSKSVDRIYISTDSEEIAGIGRQYNCSIITRPAALATDEAFLEDVLQHGFQHITADIGGPPELLVILLCNAATVTAENIERGIDMLRRDENADSVATVCLLNQYSPIRAKKINSGFLEPAVDLDQFGDAVTCDRGCTGDIFFCDASLWVLKPRCMEYEKGQLPFRWMGRKILPIIQQGGLDVDDEQGLMTTEWWLLRHGFTKTKTPYDE